MRPRHFTLNRATIVMLVTASLLVFAGQAVHAAQGGQTPPAKIDLNTASAAELQRLPGVNEASAKKIIAGRSYYSVDDLKKAGLSASTVQKIKPMASIGTPPKIDLNTATTAQLKTLPGINDAYAKKIVAGRPYKSVQDLSKAGIPKSTINRISPEVTTGPQTPPQQSPKAQPQAAGSHQTPPQQGMVWANPQSKIYHKEGDRWYGNTKNGKWMTEADAVRQGYRPAGHSEE